MTSFGTPSNLQSITKVSRHDLENQLSLPHSSRDWSLLEIRASTRQQVSWSPQTYILFSMAAPSETRGENDQAFQQSVDKPQTGSLSEAADEPQTASEYGKSPRSCSSFQFSAHELIMTFRFINSQLQLEADAREALPYVRSQLDKVLATLNPRRHSITAPTLLALSNKTSSRV